MEQEQISSKIKVGIAIDGYYFYRVSNHYANEHSVGKPIDLGGLKKFILAKVAEIMSVDVENCHIASAQYFSGIHPLEEAVRFPNLMIEERVVDEILRKEGVAPNHIPREEGKEKGIDVLLATSALETVWLKKLDVMVLISGDGDFQTLPKTLERHGCKTMLLCWDYDGKAKSDGRPNQMRNSLNLVSNVHYLFEMYMLIERGMKDEDPLVMGLFGLKPAPQKPERGKEKNTTNQPRYLLGTIKSLHKREGIVEVRGISIKFYPTDLVLDLEFSSLKKGQMVKLRKENKKGKHRVFDLSLFQ